MTSKTENKSHVIDVITYDDVLALALAETSITRFTSNSKKWHNALYEICNKYRDTIPALQDIFFIKRSPSYVQTNKFYELINILSSSGLITLPNPDYGYISMSRTQKEHVKALEENLLQGYRTQIFDISNIFQDQLARD